MRVKVMAQFYPFRAKLGLLKTESISVGSARPGYGQFQTSLAHTQFWPASAVGQRCPFAVQASPSAIVAGHASASATAASLPRSTHPQARPPSTVFDLAQEHSLAVYLQFCFTEHAESSAGGDAGHAPASPPSLVVVASLIPESPAGAPALPAAPPAVPPAPPPPAALPAAPPEPVTLPAAPAAEPAAPLLPPLTYRHCPQGPRRRLLRSASRQETPSSPHP